MILQLLNKLVLNLQNLYGDRAAWKQTSFNTRGGVHFTFTTDENNNNIIVESEDQSKSFRKNFAGVGYKYDQTRDAFIEPKPYNSWTLNETTCLWDPPVVKPNDGQNYTWNETNQNWDLIE